MGKLILITGGSRSGKSSHALNLGEAIAGRRAFIATCPPVDGEMEARIALHQETRSAERWDTIEETVDLEKALNQTPPYDVYLIDCLTLWINNLMFEGHKKNVVYSEQLIEKTCDKLSRLIKSLSATTIMVTNEVGMSVIPADPETRLYRDLIGRANQVLAAAADEVVLVTCGIPMMIKGNKT